MSNETRAAGARAPDVYIARPKPFTIPEHRERRREELRAAIENLTKERDFIVKRLEIAQAELTRLK